MLLDAASPVDAHVRFERAATASEPRAALVDAAAAGDVSFHCPTEPAEVRVDGAPAVFTWSAPTLSVTLPTGRHRIELR